MNTFGKMMIVAILAFIIVFLPSYYEAEKSDEICQVKVQNLTTKFADDVRTKGYLTEDMYFSFISQLDSTGNLYDITMEHSHMVVDPEFDDTNTIVGYEEYGVSTYEDEILTIIQDGKNPYRMTKGDYFSVTLKNRSDTLGDGLEKMLYGTKTSDITIFATAGGIIRDEEEVEE